jgi:hypothetical protein
MLRSRAAGDTDEDLSKETGGKNEENDWRLNDLNAQLAVAQQVALAMRNKAKYKNRPSKGDLLMSADATRKGNGKLNYSRMTKEYGVSNHTIKKWCIDYNIE